MKNFNEKKFVFQLHPKNQIEQKSRHRNDTKKQDAEKCIILGFFFISTFAFQMNINFCEKSTKCIFLQNRNK